jgi:ATP-dependent RNA helicase RhlE
MQFSALSIHKDLLRGLKELGFLHPTSIQAEAIPPALAGRDVIACASTGSGKTAAFLLPILHRLIDRPRGTTRALILTPTRELAAQVLEHCSDLALHTPVTAAAIYGGVGMGPQEHALRTGVDILVATPGRLLDHLRYSYANLSKLEFLVLDEADRMLDMGFLPEIRRVLRHVPARRQTLFFSATIPPPIVELSRGLLHQPEKIQLQREAAPTVGITQAVYPVPQDLKAELLISLLERGDIVQALVFTRTKHRADRLAALLKRRGVKAERIHGNRSQGQRTAALDGIKSGKYDVLVATDIASRGIDVKALGHVVNFDVPRTPTDYIHRVGRTGRAEETGDAFTFAAPQEDKEVRAIEQALKKRLPRVTVPDFKYSASAERLDSSQRSPQGQRQSRSAPGRKTSRGSAPRPFNTTSKTTTSGETADTKHGRRARKSTGGRRGRGSR